MFRQREKCAGLQYPVGLLEKLGSIGNVHGHVLRIGTIESAIRIWQVLTVAMMKGKLAFHAEQRGEFYGCFHERKSDVDAADLAPKARREISGGAAKAATNVENMVPRSDRQTIGKFNGRGKPARMIVVDRR